jgi:F420-0:gamma-glutamyl ligase-like protein
MEKKARARLSPLAVAVPVGVCVVIAAFTYSVAVRAGYPTALAVAIAGVIGLLWLGFFIGRLLEQARS